MYSKLSHISWCTICIQVTTSYVIIILWSYFWGLNILNTSIYPSSRGVIQFRVHMCTCTWTHICTCCHPIDLSLSLICHVCPRHCVWASSVFSFIVHAEMMKWKHSAERVHGYNLVTILHYVSMWSTGILIEGAIQSNHYKYNNY